MILNFWFSCFFLTSARITVQICTISGVVVFFDDFKEGLISVCVCCIWRSECSLVKPPLSTFMWLWGMSGSNDFLENIFQDFKDWLMLGWRLGWKFNGWRHSSVVECLSRIPALGSILSLVLPNVLEKDFLKWPFWNSFTEYKCVRLGMISFERMRDQTRKMSDWAGACFRSYLVGAGTNYKS